MKKLSDRLLITGPDPQHEQEFLQRLERTLQAGIRLVQLRTPGLSGTAYLRLVTAAQTLCAIHDATLILNPPIDELPLPLADTGLHLTSRRLMTLNARPTASLVGASCHNAQELMQATKLRLDYALLSPVLATTSHPQATVLGWTKFAELIAQTQLPVYALGGLKITDLPAAQQHSAQGIAAINGLWNI